MLARRLDTIPGLGQIGRFWLLAWPSGERVWRCCRDLRGRPYGVAAETHAIAIGIFGGPRFVGTSRSRWFTGAASFSGGAQGLASGKDRALESHGRTDDRRRLRPRADSTGT